MPVRPWSRRRRGAAGRGRRRGDLPAAADPADRHGGQVRPDAVEGRGADALRPGQRRCERHGFLTADTMAEKSELHPEPRSIRPRVTEHGRPDREGRAAAAAGPDHPGRAAPDQRAARDAGRPVRDGRRPALHLGGGAGKTVAAEGDRVDGDDRDGAASRSTHCSRRTEVFPPPGLDVGDNFFALQRPTSPDADLTRRAAATSASAPGTRLKAALIRVYVRRSARRRSCTRSTARTRSPTRG